eukprot:scaffold70910_cov69-Phaeocystis_antarctica.AAC.4
MGWPSPSMCLRSWWVRPVCGCSSTVVIQPLAAERVCCSARHVECAARPPCILVCASPPPSSRPTSSARYVLRSSPRSSARPSAAAAAPHRAYSSTPPVSRGSASGRDGGGGSSADAACRSERSPSPQTATPGGLSTAAHHSSACSSSSRNAGALRYGTCTRSGPRRYCSRWPAATVDEAVHAVPSRSRSERLAARLTVPRLGKSRGSSCISTVSTACPESCGGTHASTATARLRSSMSCCCGLGAPSVAALALRLPPPRELGREEAWPCAVLLALTSPRREAIAATPMAKSRSRPTRQARRAAAVTSIARAAGTVARRVGARAGTLSQPLVRKQVLTKGMAKGVA